MSAAIEKLGRMASELLGLSASARALLAEKLLASLEEDEPFEAIEKAWKREALSRYRAFKASKTSPRPHADVMRVANLKHRSESKARKACSAVIRRRRAEIHSGKAKVRRAEDVMRDALRAIS